MTTDDNQQRIPGMVVTQTQNSSTEQNDYPDNPTIANDTSKAATENDGEHDDDEDDESSDNNKEEERNLAEYNSSDDEEEEERLTEEQESERFLNKEKESWELLETDIKNQTFNDIEKKDPIQKKDLQREANLRGVPLSLLTELMQNGYESMAMDMIGYLKSVSSTSFEKLSDFVVLLSNALHFIEKDSPNGPPNISLNFKLYVLLQWDNENGLFVLLKDNDAFDVRYRAILRVYERLRTLVKEHTIHKLPDKATMKRYFRCYWRIVKWYMDNVMKIYMFSEDESKTLCRDKTFKKQNEYHEFSGKLSGYINSILKEDDESKPGIRTLINKSGGVTLWLCRQTRKKWYLPSRQNWKNERVLVLKVKKNKHDLLVPTKLSFSSTEEMIEDEQGMITVIEIPDQVSKLPVKNTSKYDIYEKIATELMREPCFDRVFVIPPEPQPTDDSTEEQTNDKTEEETNDIETYTMSDLEPNLFLEMLMTDNFVFPGSPVVLGASSFHVQLANRMRTKFKVDYNICPSDPLTQSLCKNLVDIHKYGRIEQGMLKKFAVHEEYVTVVLSQKMSKKNKENLTQRAKCFFDVQQKVPKRKDNQAEQEADADAKKAEEEKRIAAILKEKERKKNKRKRKKRKSNGSDQRDKKKTADKKTTDDVTTTDREAGKQNTPDDKQKQKEINEVYASHLKTNFVNYLKHESENFVQDELRNAKHTVFIDMNANSSEEQIKSSFKSAEEDHRNVLGALRDGISLVFHFEDKNSDVTINLNAEDFVVNDNYKNEDLNDTDNSDDSEGRTVHQSAKTGTEHIVV